ncbi:T9SS type A sorting domain-containing protein [Chryseobacterium sp. FH1]|uniref:T9SS type A sorting domain-containing protein n=1 Tax=Chryseobacterium sp. FH1 TaxID=1233951 RepID=UPI0004E3BDF2|nr:T9SS type A sorting domain-containing protein [Chryseobacterium sp. FH1]KFC24146.1 hypothetical protein IO90_02240 [Chryseobacterium sp. FH1]
MKKIYFILLLVSTLLFSQKGNINIDSNFANNGSVLISAGSGSLYKNLDDSFFVVYLTGYFPLSYSINKYNSEGVLDTTFGNLGQITSQNYAQDSFRIDKNGYIYLLENANNTQDWFLKRYTPSGIIDSSFGVQGKTSITSGLRYGKVELYQNKIYINLLDVNNKKTNVYRFDLNGSIDSVFGTAGILTLDNALSYTKLSNDKILGVVPTVFNNFSALVQYNLDGTKDTSFANNGVFEIDSEFYLPSGNVANIDENGNINLFLAKSASNSNDTKKLVKLKSNGTQDISFNNTGSFTYTSTNVYYSYSFRNNNEIYLVGMGNGAYVSRINNSGLDASFNQNGIKREDSFQIFSDGFVQSNNRLICLGLVPGTDGNSRLSIVGFKGDNQLSTNDTKTSYLRVYPNPTNDFLIFDGIQESNFSVRIADVSGRTVKHKKDNQKIDVRNLVSGTYYIEIVTLKNTFKKTFIKK